MILWIAIAILNTIALIAILVANRELERALREMDKLSVARSVSFDASHDKTMS